MLPNSDEKYCCVPVDRQGEQNDPIRAISFIMMRVTTQDSSPSWTRIMARMRRVFPRTNN